jgi:hypothetical protein
MEMWGHRVFLVSSMVDGINGRHRTPVTGQFRYLLQHICYCASVYKQKGGTRSSRLPPLFLPVCRPICSARKLSGQL